MAPGSPHLMDSRDFEYRVTKVIRIGDLQLDELELGAAAPPVPRHFHERGLLALTVRGPVVDEHCGERSALLPGSMLCLPPGEPHAVSFPAGFARVFTMEFGAGWLAQSLGGEGEFPVDALRANCSQVSGAAARLYRRFAAGPDTPGLHLEELVLALFDTADSDRRPASRRPPAWLRRAREVVHDMAGESVRMSDVAAAVGVHPVTLSRAFRQTWGVTLSSFLLCRRLELARTALATTDLHVGAVALASGFADHAHLSRTFRKAVGMTPTEYRSALRRAGGPTLRRVTPTTTRPTARQSRRFRASDAGIFAV